MIETQIVGDTAVLARLDSMPLRIHARVLQTVTRLGIDLHALVVAKLSGTVLHRRTGRLAQSQNRRVTDTPVEITTAVGFNRGTVPYGAIHEFGGTTRAHVIEAINAAALRFQVGGKTVFAKKVNHPGSKIPERSFLRSSLKEMAPEAIAEIKAAAVTEAQA